MNTRLFGCRKFKVLSNDEADRELHPREQRFMEKHRRVCTPCREMETSSFVALNMLRGATLDVQVGPHFDERVLRRLKVRTVRESFGYWSPAFLGAGIACLVLFTALQMIARPTQLKSYSLPAGQVNNRIEQPLPRLDLKVTPRLQ